MRKFNIALGIFAIAGTLGALWCWQQLQSERVHSADLERRLATWRVRAIPASVPAPARQPQEKPPSGPTSPVARSASQDNLPAREREVRDYVRAAARHEREMLRDPTYRNSQLQAGRRQFARTRADAIRVVGMTPEQADRVIDLWVERNMRFTELGGVSVDSPSEAMLAEMKRAADAEQTELRALLGEDKYQQWNRYLASGQVRAEIDQFRLQLSAGTDPLRVDQADALVEAIYSERERSSREYEDYVRAAGITNRYVVSANDRQQYLDLEHAANQRIHDAVSGALSGEQLAALDEMLKARLAPSEAELRLQLEGRMAKSN